MLDDLTPIIERALLLPSDDERGAAELNAALRPGIDALGAGEWRAVIRQPGRIYKANQQVKKLILAYFKTGRNEPVNVDRLSDGFDRIKLRYQNDDQPYLEQHGIRLVHGAIVREGAYLGPNTVIMPGFVNIGAHIGQRTMIDTWATVGSCAQIGSDVHISGGAGIGGVLEPIGANPVIIEDNVFIGARSEVVEGVIVREGAVLSMGVFIGKTTPIVDASSGEKWTGEIPANAVVVPGAIQVPGTGISTYAAVIKKYADESTRSKLKLDDTFRGKSQTPPPN